MSKELAIMSAPSFGVRDIGQPCFWFSVRFGEDLTCALLIVLGVKEMSKIVKEADIYDTKELKNHPCQIETEGNTVNFVKVLKK